MWNIRQLWLTSVCTLLCACITSPQPLDNRNSQLTQGNVQMNLIVGTTTKAEVLETFGAPNITTRDRNGSEVWTYQRAAQVSQSSSRSGFWNVLLLVDAIDTGTLAGGSSSAAGFESSSRMMTLIINFNENDVVSNFRSRASEF